MKVIYEKLVYGSLNFFYLAMGGVAFVYFIEYLEFKNIDNYYKAFILVMSPLSQIISILLWSFLADKLSIQKHLLIVLSVFSTIMPLFLYLTDDYIMIIVIFLLFNIFQRPIGTLTTSATLEFTKRIHSDYGRYRLLGTIAFLLTLFIFAIFPQSPNFYNLIPLFITILFIPNIIAALFVKGSKIAPYDNLIKDIFKITRNKNIWFFISMMFFHFFSMSFYNGYFTRYVKASLDLQHLIGSIPWGFGVLHIDGLKDLFVAIFWFFGIVPSELLVMAFSKKIFKRFTFKNLLFFLFITTSFRWFCWGISDNLIVLISGQLMHGITFGIGFLASVYYFEKHFSGQLMNSGQGVFSGIVLGASGFIGTMLVGWLYGAMNWSGNQIFLLMSAFSIIALIHLPFFKAELHDA